MHLHASPTSADQEQQADEHLLHISTVYSETAESDDSASSGAQAGEFFCVPDKKLSVVL